MHYFVITLVAFFVSFSINPLEKESNRNALEGAWEMDLPGSEMRTVMTLQAPYVFISMFNEDTKEFFGAQGGTVELLGNTLVYKIEFHTTDSNEIGKEYEIITDLKRNRLTATIEVDGASQSVDYVRIDAGDAELAGSWRITDRMRDGEMQAMQLGSRKTIKMITGTRFQWVAFDPESKRFSGTGGGTMTLSNGKYTEHIEFFSRNSERVGATLSFEYELDNDKWIHSGFSSSGSPIKEIWTKQ